FSTRIAAEVKDFDAAALGADRKLLKFANRSHRFALGAAEQAIRDAGIAPTAATATRWRCSVGTGMMGVAYEDLSAVQRHSAADGELHADQLVDDPTASDPIVFCRSQSTGGLALLTRRFGIHGYATSVHTACASGGQAIGTALKLIRRGSVDYALAGGFDSMISPSGWLDSACCRRYRPTTTRRNARAAHSTRRETASCSAKAQVLSCSRNGKRRAGAARISMPSSPETAIRCLRTASPIRRRTATARSSRCAQPWPTPAPRRTTSITSTPTAHRPT